MRVGLVGLGRMGANMAARWRAAGHDVVGYSRDAATSDVTSLAELVEALDKPRVVWLMIPVAAIEKTIDELCGYLDASDLVIDGGNSRYTDDLARRDQLAGRGVRYLDVGVSGGVWGRHNGYALMVGGDADAVALATPLFDALKPAGEYGFVHAGGVGAGHYAKMVHNGIEYALMQAYAEGYELLRASDVVDDVPGVIKSWRDGTVIRSWLLDLLDQALDDDPELGAVRPFVEDTGEGRWTVDEAVRLAVPANVMAAALFARFASRQDDSPAMKAVAALRGQFGGHAVQKG